MNCPHHAQIYASQPRSYRDLPIRYSETTMVYRDEQSGELGGLSRVRAITQDDAHVFCRLAQTGEEITKIWNIIQTFYATFDIKLDVRLSLHDPAKMEDYLGEAKQWKQAEAQLKAVIESKDVTFTEAVGDAAFYGPKIDFVGQDVFGREFQAATIQLDFGQPEGFDLNCVNEAGEHERIIMIHAAIMGSIERFLVLVIEATAGAFPTWLAPEQVRLAPVNDTTELAEYVENLRHQIAGAGLRVGIDSSAESVGKKIRAAGLAKVPYTLVIGDKERESKLLNPRLRQGHGEEPGEMSLETFVDGLNREISERAGHSVF
jgi:threonyl-tRNA synthetase